MYFLVLQIKLLIAEDTTNYIWTKLKNLHFSLFFVCLETVGTCVYVCKQRIISLRLR